MITQHIPWRRRFAGLPLAILALFAALPLSAASPKFRVLAIAEKGGLHQPFVDAAKTWLAREAQTGGFTVDYVEDTARIDDAFLSQYRLFIQLNYPPYRWEPRAAAAFQRYIEERRGGWIGFHHATLLGEFDSYPMWPWFSTFMGGIRFLSYIPTFATGKVAVEAPSHPVMQGLGNSFTIENEEWYTYDKSPRPNVHVLASVDEKSYSPPSSIRMGDHPVVWTNERVKARNVYIQMGHHGELFQNPAFATLVHNAILWASQAPQVPPRVLAFWSPNVEGDHAEFARQSIDFYRRASSAGQFQFDSTTDWDDLNSDRLADAGVVLWLNDSPHTASQRVAFETYMEHGGAWIGFHAAAYNDSSTHWPWFVRFLGGAVFYGNNWPPLPGWLAVDDPSHPVTSHLPARFQSPDNEWYSWRPSPRANPDVKVLLTLEPTNFPIGLKDTIAGGDVPVAWTNTKYRMIYFNMGHGDKIFTNPRQNRIFEDALIWLARHP